MNIAQEIKIAVRDKQGIAHIFKVQHEEIQTHEQAIILAKQEFPDAICVICTVPVFCEELAA